YVGRASNPFPEIRSHVLLRWASELASIDAELAGRLMPELLDEIVGGIPNAWLDDPAFADPEEQRADYVKYFRARLEPPRAFLKEAKRLAEASRAGTLGSDKK